MAPRKLLPEAKSTESISVMVVSGSEQMPRVMSLLEFAVALSTTRQGEITFTPTGVDEGTASGVFNPTYPNASNITVAFVLGNNVAIDTENIDITSTGWSAPYQGSGTTGRFIAVQG